MASPDLKQWLLQAARGSAMDHDDVRRSALRALSTLGYSLGVIGYGELAVAIYDAIEDMLHSIDSGEPLDSRTQRNVLLEIQKELRNV